MTAIEELSKRAREACYTAKGPNHDDVLLLCDIVDAWEKEIAKYKQEDLDFQERRLGLHIKASLPALEKCYCQAQLKSLMEHVRKLRELLR